MSIKLKSYYFIAVLTFMLMQLGAYGQVKDTLDINNNKLTNINIQDKIIQDTSKKDHVKIDTSLSKHSIKNLIIKNLFSQNFSEEKDIAPINKFEKYEGKIIDSIFILRERPFNPDKAKKKFEKFLLQTANAMHTATRESVIDNELLFSSGERVREQNLSNTLSRLRDLGIFSSVEIEIQETSKNIVNVYIFTHDNFPERVGLNYRYSRDADFFLNDKNFLGYGNSLTFRYFVNFAQKDYAKGFSLGHYVNNFLNTKAGLETVGSYGKDFYLAKAMIDKPFLVDGDFAVGAGYLIERTNSEYIDLPDSDHIDMRRQYAKLWGGKSFPVGDYNNNIYFNAGTFYTKYFKRPEVAPQLNPYFHNTVDFICSAGFYRQKHYSGNLIYGYGNTETIHYGYQLEMTGGLRIDEFENLPYLGLRFKMGNLIKIGYLYGDFNFGSFYSLERKVLETTVAKVKLSYFSPLIRLSGSGYKLRQFWNISYTSGFNLSKGERNSIVFNNYYGLISVSHDRKGNTCLEASGESVLFTPLQLYGFRFAFFGFMNIGNVGYYNNPFKNEFYGIMGVGARMRNEKLVLSTLQIRVGVAIRSSSEWRNSLYKISSESKLVSEKFIPQEPYFLNIY
ncbi:MAG: hypothetical protein IMY73_05255 [Bacteroidetes bacterium]|nr:hypothetical protein [Bacteroidota bacterium]